MNLLIEDISGTHFLINISPGQHANAALGLTRHARGDHLERSQMNTIRAITRKVQRDNGDFGPPEKPTNLSIVFAPRQGSEVIPQALTRVTVPGGNCDGKSNPPERVVVLDSDSSHAVALSDTLIRSRFDVGSFRTREMLIETLKRNHADLAVIVFRSPSWWRTELQSFCDAVRRMDNPPEIICILRWPPKGPGDRLFGDELNVVVLHER